MKVVRAGGTAFPAAASTRCTPSSYGSLAAPHTDGAPWSALRSGCRSWLSRSLLSFSNSLPLIMISNPPFQIPHIQVEILHLLFTMGMVLFDVLSISRKNQDPYVAVYKSFENIRRIFKIHMNAFKYKYPTPVKLRVIRD